MITNAVMYLVSLNILYALQISYNIIFYIHLLLNAAQVTVSDQFIADKSSKQFRRQKELGQLETTRFC